jgi:hypothetical protein
VAVATGSGPTVESAIWAAYAVTGGVKWPSNRMYRTDVGKKLAGELPFLQSLGYARGMSYSDNG